MDRLVSRPGLARLGVSQLLCPGVAPRKGGGRWALVKLDEADVGGSCVIGRASLRLRYGRAAGRLMFVIGYFTRCRKGEDDACRMSLARRHAAGDMEAALFGAGSAIRVAESLSTQ